MTDSDDEELLYGCLGTQFNVETDESIENKRLKLKRKAAEEEVTDEKGRALRFHGAFTGGFSAGYFNTVGSKEGFTPQQFVSSRKINKDNDGERKYRAFKPEDFMDDEDFSEHGIAPKMIQVNSEFDDGNLARGKYKESLGRNNIFGNDSALKDIFVPERVTIGIKLMKKLGYLASSGVGEVDSDGLSDDNDGNDEVVKTSSSKFQYNAENVYQLSIKMNKFGIGYSGIQRNELFTNSSNQIDDYSCNSVNFGYKTSRVGGGIKGAAFQGVTFDDDHEEYDNHDFFQKESLSKYNYELIEQNEEEIGNNYGWTAPKSIKNALMSGSGIIGFQNGKKFASAAVKLSFEPLKLPRFYIPIYPLRKKEHSVEYNTNYRAKLMPDSHPDSVFNFINPQDRDRLVNSGSSKLERGIKRESRWGDRKPESRQQSQPEKEEDMWQQSQNKFKMRPNPKMLDLFGINDMSGMFKSGGKSTETADINLQIQTVGATVMANETSDRSREDSDTELKKSAALAGNYGFMTRVKLEWHPDKLVAKRFNVPDPFPLDKYVGINDSSNNATNDDIVNENHDVVEPLAITAVPIREEVSVTTIAPIADDDIKAPEISVIDLSSKPPIDLFKSVFEESDLEFSDSEDEKELSNQQISVETSKNPPQDNPDSQKPTSIISSLSEALGFMIGPQSTNHNGPSHKQLIPTTGFGPELPPDFVYEAPTVTNKPTVINDIISKNIYTKHFENTDYEYKESAKLKKSKHKKKKEDKKKEDKKKSKKSKKKKSKKTKKRKHKESSSDESNGDDSDD